MLVSTTFQSLLLRCSVLPWAALPHAVLLLLLLLLLLQGFCASLELLPMGANVDPDCELFASGIVKDDEDDWGVGAHPLAVKQAVAPAKVGGAGLK
jgi:hypothetical protein